MAVQRILRQLAYDTDFRFEALIDVIGEQPVPLEHAWDREVMRKDWLRRGREHGYECKVNCVLLCFVMIFAPPP